MYKLARGERRLWN